MIDKGKRGKRWRISSDLLHRNIKEQFLPFKDQLFKCDDKTFRKGNYNGTIFRFPLRSKVSKSKLSRVVYDDARVENLFQSFQNDAEISLLFLKNVESVSLFQRNKWSEEPELLFQVKVGQRDLEALRLERSLFVKKCQKNSESYLGQSEMEINTFSERTAEEVGKYLVVNLLKRQGLSKELNELLEDADLKQLPWVGMAVKTNPIVAKSGRVFCFLPLPESECSNLPVHVHGYFGLGDNRRSIKWPDRESKHDSKSRWNQQIITEVFPEAYIGLIEYAIQQGYPALEVYKLWPEIEVLGGVWKQGVKDLINKLSEKAVLYTEAKGGSWETLRNVYVNTDHNDVIKKVMLRKDKPVVQLPSNVLDALRWADKDIREVTPQLLKQIIRHDALQFIDRKEKLCLLQYILKDEKVSDLDNIHLLPLQDGQLVPFSRRGRSVYIPNSDVPRYLFPNMDFSLVSKDCPGLLRSSKEVQENTQLVCLTIDIVPTLLKECLPTEWINGDTFVTWSPGSDNQPEKEWLRKLWTWMRKVDISLHSFESLPLIQLRESTNWIKLARIVENQLIYQQDTEFSNPTELSDKVCSFVESHGGVVVRNDLPKFIARHHQIPNLIQPGNGKGLMKILESRWSSEVPNQVAKCSTCLKRDLVTLFTQIPSIPSQWKELIRSLAIFKATDGKYCSIQDCTKAVPEDFHGIPVEELSQRFILLNADVKKLLQDLDVLAETLKSLLKDHVFPDVEKHYYKAKQSHKIMRWVLERPFLDELTKQVKFVPTSDKSYSTTQKLFHPGNKLMTSLFRNWPKFPVNIYASDVLLEHLKRIGLRRESSVSAQEILEIAQEVSNAGDVERGEALLTYVCRYPGTLSSTLMHQQRLVSLGAILKEIQWLPCEQPRSSYPTSLPWYGRDDTLYRPDEVDLIEKANLLGSVTPLVTTSDENSKLGILSIFGWKRGFEHVPIDKILEHLRNISKACYSERHFNRICEIVSSIYDYLTECRKSELESRFTRGGIMQNESWVWHGRGFTTTSRIAFKSIVLLDNVPYLFVVPPELKRFKSLLIKLGVKESLSCEDFINVMETLHKSKKGKSLNKVEMRAVQEIIKGMTSLGDICSFRSQILLPDQRCVLRYIDEVTYDETSQNVTSEDYIYTHDSLTRREAKQLGVRTHRDVQLDRCSSDLGFEVPFGQKEKLTTRLRGILREYSHTPDVLKELLQNADDAGASEIHVVYDPRKHKGAKIVGKEWKPMHRSPAICVYNDKPFTDEDIEGIQNVGVGGKISDATTIGRFGIGFNAVYHLTDCPTFLTQKTTKLCVFDPHVIYVPRSTANAPGKLYTVNKDHDYRQTCPDMIEGYLDEYEDFDLEKGTMFRFPLRQDGLKSEISEVFYTNDDALCILQEFEDISKEALLFLNSVQKISISEIDVKTNELCLRYQVKADIAKSDKQHRGSITKQLEKYCRAVDPSMTNARAFGNFPAANPGFRCRWPGILASAEKLSGAVHPGFRRSNANL